MSSQRSGGSEGSINVFGGRGGGDRGNGCVGGGSLHFRGLSS